MGQRTGEAEHPGFSEVAERNVPQTECLLPTWTNDAHYAGTD
ncbi:MAG: hypothetical protein ACK5MA_04855 [Parachlamydiaceae bacterium]